jgi:hypothetical protein
MKATLFVLRRLKPLPTSRPCTVLVQGRQVRLPSVPLYAMPYALCLPTGGQALCDFLVVKHGPAVR